MKTENFLCLVALFCSLGYQAHSQDLVNVKINSQKQFQEIEGFGASIIGWRDDVIPIYEDEQYLDFVVNQLGLSIFRMQIWPNVSTEPIENIEDIRHEDFNWEGPGNRGRVNMNFAKRILEINPEIKIIGSIWSPPAWMKDNKAIDGTRAGFIHDPGRKYDIDNRLSDHMYDHYAKWIYEWIEYMREQDVPLYALGPQNELMFTEPYESSMFTGDEFARLVLKIGQRFEQEGSARPIIYGPEDMTLATYEPDNPTARHSPYVNALMQEEVAPYFDVFATHGYTDGVQAGGRLDPKKYWESIKQFGRPYWITEGGTGGHEWPTPIEDGVASYIHHALVDGHVSAFVCWQISDVERSTHGIMDMKTPTKKTFAAMHYWKYIRPGFVRVQAESENGDVRVSAFKDPTTDRLVIVVINNKPGKEILDVETKTDNGKQFVPYVTSQTKNFEKGEVIAVEDSGIQVEMEGNSIMTLVGSY